MLGLMGFSGSLPLYVIHRYYIFVFIDRANKDACLLTNNLVISSLLFHHFHFPVVRMTAHVAACKIITEVVNQYHSSILVT